MDDNIQYEPEVDDYVIWDRGEYGKDEGWFYLKGDPVEIKKGFNECSRYITIETAIRPKHMSMIARNDPHKYVHTLLLCYEQQWKELKFVKRRDKKAPDHYAEYDNISGNDS